MKFRKKSEKKMQAEDSILLDEKVTINKMRVLKTAATLAWTFFIKFREWSKKVKLALERFL